MRALIKDIVADVDEEEAREAILVVQWRGGHIRNCGSKNPTCGHDCQTPGEPLAVMRSMAGRWDDDHIAASLNRMGMRTGHGKSRNAERAGSLRRVHDIHAYRSADKNDEWLTMSEAATKLGVTHHVIRRLIPNRILAAEQVVPGAPYQIKASDLRDNRVAAALLRRTRPCQADRQTDFQCFPMLEEGRW